MPQNSTISQFIYDIAPRTCYYGNHENFPIISYIKSITRQLLNDQPYLIRWLTIKLIAGKWYLAWTFLISCLLLWTFVVTLFPWQPIYSFSKISFKLNKANDCFWYRNKFDIMEENVVIIKLSWILLIFWPLLRSGFSTDYHDNYYFTDVKISDFVSRKTWCVLYYWIEPHATEQLAISGK